MPSTECLILCDESLILNSNWSLVTVAKKQKWKPGGIPINIFEMELVEDSQL